MATIKKQNEHSLRKQIALQKVATATKTPIKDVVKSCENMQEKEIKAEAAKAANPDKFNAMAAMNEAKESFNNTLKALMKSMSIEERTARYQQFTEILNGV